MPREPEPWRRDRGSGEVDDHRTGDATVTLLGGAGQIDAILRSFPRVRRKSTGNVLQNRGSAMSHPVRNVLHRAALAVLLALVPLSAGIAPVSAAKAPVGYQIFCLKNPGECKGGGASEIALTDHVMQLLKSVNASVNRSIRPRHDKGADVWSANATSGDCEDYVLAKRRALIKAGLPSSALRIAYVKTRKGEGHAILVVVTDGKKWVLDNINGRVRPLSQSGYRLISMSGANPRSWS